MHDPGNKELAVLVLSITARDYELTRDILGRAGIETIRCTDIADLCAKMAAGAGALLVIEEALTGGQHTKLTACLAAQPSWSDIPLLILVDSGANSPQIARLMDKVGTVTVLERPTRIVILVSAVRTALAARSRQYQVRDDAIALEAARDELEARVHARTSELREANEQLEQKIQEAEAAEWRARELLSRLVNAQETERARIARDLHDELGQQLTGLRLRLTQLSRDIGANEEARRTLELSEKEAERIDSRVSFLAWMIRPTAIEELGLTRAVKGYLKEWSRNFDIAAAFRGGPEPRNRLTAEIEVNVYRIAQECLNNISKYAHATSVGVLLSISKSEVTLIVEDDGVGFDPNSVHSSSNGGIGIIGMRERAELLNGTFQVESGAAKGTTIYTRIPTAYR